MASKIDDDGHRDEPERDSSATSAASESAPKLIIANAGKPSAQNQAHNGTGAEPAVDRLPLFQGSDEGAESDNETNSERVTSPSVTSPPYWTSHGHQRAASDMSAESVPLPGAITLQDNEDDDDPDGTNVYGRDRNRACWARSVQIKDYVLVNESATNLGAFVVWNITVETLNVSLAHTLTPENEHRTSLIDELISLGHLCRALA